MIAKATAGSGGTPDTFDDDEEAVIVPGTTGTTARPDLRSASLESNGSVVDFNFDRPIGTAFPGGALGIDLSDGEFIGGTSAVITNTPRPAPSR